MEKGEILDRTYNLYHEHCDGCQKWKQAGTKKHLDKVQKFCNTKCPIGREILELGDRLVYGRPTRKGRSLIKEVYLEEIESGLSDGEICTKHGLSEKVLNFRKHFWGLIDPPKEHRCTKENYIREKKENPFLPDIYISRILGVAPNTLARYKVKWGIRGSKSDKLIVTAENGDSITPGNYITYKQSGMIDEEIRALWGIGRTTLQVRKQQWRSEGYDVDCHTKANITGLKTINAPNDIGIASEEVIG